MPKQAGDSYPTISISILDDAGCAADGGYNVESATLEVTVAQNEP